MSGPCSDWVTLGAVKADPRATLENGDPLPDALLEEWITVASILLYRFSGRQFAGVCSDLVRPCRRYYPADFPPLLRLAYGQVIGFTPRSPHRYAGAAPLSEITLGQYPLRDITEVRVDGDVVDPSTYRIDDRRWLVRIDPSGVGWPPMQDLSANPATDYNTFSVAFTYGEAPDDGGVAACKTYAIELAKGASGDPCNLPERVQTITTQGVSFALLDPFKFLDQSRTGIYAVDAWLRSVNPMGNARRSIVYSPDFPRPVRRTNTVPGS